MAEKYSVNGVKLRHPFPCPKCRHPHGPVVTTHRGEGGEIIRRRSCPECGHAWFTMQEPEYLLRKDAVEWRNYAYRLKDEAAAA